MARASEFSAGAQDVTADRDSRAGMAAAPDPAKLAKLIQSAPSGPSLAEQFTQAGTSPYAAYGSPQIGRAHV